MTDARSRRAHLLALASEAEREADRLFADENYEDGERFKKLADTYRGMAEATNG